MRTLPLLVTILTSAHARAEPRRVAVMTPEHGTGDAVECAALVIADGLTEALAGRTGDQLLLDRPLVRTLEREGGEGAPTGAELEVAFEVFATKGGFDVKVKAPAGLTTKSFAAADAAGVVAALADGVLIELGAPPSVARPFVPFPPTGACARLARAWELFDATDPAALAKAKVELEAARAAAPKDGRVLAALAEVMVRSGEVEPAIPIAQEAVSAAPELAQAHWSLGLAYDYADRFDAAMAAYRAANDVPVGVVAARVNAGILERRALHLASALQLLEEATRRAPTWFVAHYNLAAAYVAARDGRAALATLGTRTVPSRYTEERALLAATAQLLVSEPDKARALVEPLVEHPRVGLRARVLVARALAYGADPAGALAAIDRVLAEKDLPADVHGSLVVARVIALRAAKKEDALAWLREQVKADAAMNEPLLHRALVAFGGAGIEVLEALVQKHPGDDETWYDLGVLREREGDHKGAASAYERAAEANPRAAWALYNRGLIAFAEDGARGALPWLEAAHAVDGEAADISAALEAARARL